MKPREIRALIQLLDDPDDQVFEMVAENLRASDTSVVPYLEEAWENSPDELFQDRIEVLIHQIQFREVTLRLTEWYHLPGNDLLEGVFWLARYQYPDLRLEDISREIRNIARDIWLELQENLTALEKIRILNHILFEVHRFSANHGHFYSPRNNYINAVLESKKGNPISLSVVYSLVAAEVNIPVLGVNLPKNFIVAYRDEYRSKETYDPDLDDHILFYINPYNRGAVLGRAELDLFLKQQGLDLRKEFFTPCSNNQIIDRLLNNLIFSYQKMGNREKARELEELSETLKKQPGGL
ncbi:MAG: transglutaminase family protein [Bacteroidales bacterium]